MLAEGLGLAVVKSGSGAVSQITGGALGRQINIGKVRKQLDGITSGDFLTPRLDALGDLQVSTLKRLVDFIEGREFQLVTNRIAALAFSKNSEEIPLEHKLEFERLIFLHVLPDENKATLLAEIIVEHLRPTILAYLQQTRAAELVPVATIAGNIPSAKILESVKRRHETVLQRLVTLSDTYTYARELNESFRAVRDRMVLPAESRDSSPSVPFSELYVPPPADISQTTRVVLKGNPGAGKSTFATHFALNIVADSLSKDNARTVFFLVLREIAKGLVEGKKTIIQCIEDTSRSPYNVVPPANSVEYLLLSGRAVLVLDGLDEIPIIAHRQAVVDSVHAFQERYPDAPIIATSRIVGYDVAPLDRKYFFEVEIPGFGTRQVREYVRKRFALAVGSSSVEVERRVDEFMQATNSTHDLRSNPLMLSLMCNLSKTEGWVPRNRPELYQKCSELLYSTWDNMRLVEGLIPYSPRVKSTIPKLAEWMFKTDTQGKGIQEARVIDFIKRSLFPSAFEDEDEAEEVARDVVKFCTGRAWVLANTGSDKNQERYGFVHKTFLEYFTAVNIRRRSSSPEQLLENILPLIEGQSNEVIWEICVQLYDEQEESAADKIVVGFLDRCQRDGPIPFSAALVYIVRALVLRSVEPETRRRVASSVLSIPQNSDGLSITCELLTSAAENLRTVSSFLFQDFDVRNYDDLFVQIRPELIAESSHYYDPNLHGSFWTSDEIRDAITGIVTRMPARVADQPAPTWWVITRFLYGVVDFDEISHLLSASNFTLPQFREETCEVPPSLIFLQLLLDGLEGVRTPGNQGFRDLVHEPEQCTAILELLEAHGFGASYIEMRLTRRVVWNDFGDRVFPTDRKLDHRINSLIAVLGAMYVDFLAVARPEVLGNEKRDRFWHRLMGGRFADIPLNEYQVTGPTREFLLRWLRGGFRSLDGEILALGESSRAGAKK